MPTFILAKMAEAAPTGRTSVHAILKSPYNDTVNTTYALMKYLRENNIQFSVRQHRTRKEAILVFNFGSHDYVVRSPYGDWNYLVLHKDWFNIPEWTLPILNKNEQGGAP